jgi:hypothetical protein
MKRRYALALFWGWQVGSMGTFIVLTFFDDYPYNAWNWLIVVPRNFVLAELWPLYWGVLRWAV